MSDDFKEIKFLDRAKLYAQDLLGPRPERIPAWGKGGRHEVHA